MTDSDKIVLGVITYGLCCYVLGVRIGMRYADPVAVTNRSKDLWIRLNPEHAKKVFEAGSTFFMPATPIGDLFVGRVPLNTETALKMIS